MVVIHIPRHGHSDEAVCLVMQRHLERYGGPVVVTIEPEAVVLEFPNTEA